MTKKDAMRAAVEALEMAHTGLMWYRGMMPEYADGSDDEADEQIDAALSLLRSALEEGEEPHPMRNGYAGSVMDSKPALGHKLAVFYETRDQADAAHEWLAASPTADKEQP